MKRFTPFSILLTGCLLSSLLLGGIAQAEISTQEEITQYEEAIAVVEAKMQTTSGAELQRLEKSLTQLRNYVSSLKHKSSSLQEPDQEPEPEVMAFVEPAILEAGTATETTGSDDLSAVTEAVESLDAELTAFRAWWHTQKAEQQTPAYEIHENLLASRNGAHIPVTEKKEAPPTDTHSGSHEVITESTIPDWSGVVEDAGFELSGFVDAANARDMTVGEGTFSFDQAELDIERTISERGYIRLDIEYVNGSEIATADEVMEQAYMEYRSSLNGGATAITFGKFNAPIGFELLDPVDMYQYSHALVFDNGLPTNLTGLMWSWSTKDAIDFNIYAVNGWDNNVDNNDAVTFGGRIGFPLPGDWGVGLSLISGPEQDGNQSDRRSVFDCDLAGMIGERLTIGGEFNLGSETISDEDESVDAAWSGFLGMAHYDFTSWFGLTGRIGSFADDKGSRTGMDQTLWAYTISPTFVLGEKMGALLEYRFDTSNKDFWEDSEGKPTDRHSGIAVEMTYSF